ncbi:MAG: HEAT repeat domain-containing protein [Myxococcaceae bacterium]|nr:HEAT repeat domain-containing protein [Myxococcaceae bacterium]
MRPFLVPVACAAVLFAACDGSRDALLAELQSTRPEERALAVRKLSQQAKPEDLVLFTRAAKDMASTVRAEAATALGKSQDPRVVDLLGELLGDPDEQVQAKAAMALAEIKGEKSHAYLTMQYARRGRSTRIAIVEALKSANVPGAMAAVVAAESKTLWDRNLGALNGGSLPERVAAAEEIGKSGRVEAVNRLLPLIKDSQVILAAAAVRGLGYAGDPRAVEPIAQLLSENFPELREAATQALVRLKDPKALPRLKEIALEKSASSSLAAQAIIGLPVLPETNAALCEVALSGAPEDALSAGRTMRARGGCPLEPILERLGRRSEQLAALHALEGLGPTAKDAGPKVIPLIQSSDEAVRFQAIDTAGELGIAEAIESIRKVYEAELERVRKLRADWIPDPLPQKFKPGYDPAGAVIAEEPGSSAEQKQRQEGLFRRIRELNEAKLKSTGRSALVRVNPPAEIVDDASEEELELLAKTLRALGKLGAPGAIGLLRPFIHDPSPTLRTAAYQGLAALGPDGVALAREGLTDELREVQGEVAAALVAEGEAGQAAIAEILPKLAADRMPLLIALDAGGVPSQVTAPALIAALKEGGAESALAAQLLGRMKVKDAVGPLMKILEDPTAVARREALLSLGQIGDPAAADLIARDLNSDSPDVRAAAADALALLGVNPRPDALDALKGDYYRRVRESAEAALAKLGGAPEAKRQE